MTLKIDWMLRHDMEQVLQIEAQSFEPASCWTHEDFLSSLQQRLVIGSVAREGRKVLGYCVYELGDRLQGDREVRIQNLAVHPDHRRQGAASLLVKKLLSKLSTFNRNCLVCNVGDHNTAAHLFLRSQGLIATRVLRDAIRDTYRFEYELDTAPVLDDAECEGR